MFTNHSALKYLVNKPVLGGNICRWLFLFQEFDFEIIVKLGRMGVEPNHLSQLETREEPTNLDDNLTDAQLVSIKIVDEYYKDIIHFFTTGRALDGYNIVQKKKLVVKSEYFQLIFGQLYKMGHDENLHHCVLQHEWPMILVQAHDGVEGGHYAGKETT